MVANTTARLPGDMEKLLLSLGLVIGLYLGFIFLEVMYQYIHRLSISRTVLLPNTYVMDSKSLTISQNPQVAQSKPVSLSDNERAGIEFSYSFYLNVDASAFTNYAGLLHIFHKGYPSQFPLLGPGVYMHSNENTLRIYMNTYHTWNHYIDVPNLPVAKWVHVVLACTQSAMEVYVNGNLSKKLSFDGYAPYQNYQDIICFSPMKKEYRHSSIPSVDEQGFTLQGALKGMLSRLTYFSYALSYSEIQTLMNEGPSPNMDSTIVNEVPPYLADNWWASS